MIIERNSCHIWWARLNECPPNYEILNEEEFNRINLLKFPKDIVNAAASFTFLRLVLSNYVGINPKEIGISRTCKQCGGPHGKPELISYDKYINFNVSHTSEYIVVGITTYSDIGIDIEEIDDDLDLNLFSSVLNKQELKYLNSVSNDKKKNNFIKYWTRKESIVKATGIGLSTDLADLFVSNCDSPPVIIEWSGHEEDINKYHLYDFSINKQVLGCITTLNKTENISFYDGNKIIDKYNQKNKGDIYEKFIG